MAVANWFSILKSLGGKRKSDILIKIKQKIQIERKPIAAKKILPKTEMEMKRKLIYVLTQKKLAK